MSTRRAQETMIELAGTGDGVSLARSRPSVTASDRAVSGGAFMSARIGSARAWVQLSSLLIAVSLAAPAQSVAQPAIDEYTLDLAKLETAQGSEAPAAEAGRAADTSGVPIAALGIVLLASICVAVAVWQIRRHAR